MRMNESLLQKCTRHYKMQDYARLYCIRNANACDFDIFDSWPFPSLPYSALVAEARPSHASSCRHGQWQAYFKAYLNFPNLGMESSELQDSTSAKAQHTQTAHIRVSCIKQEPAWASWQFPWLVNLDKLLFAILQGIHFRTTPWISVRLQQVNGMSRVLEFWSTMFQFGMGHTVTD